MFPQGPGQGSAKIEHKAQATKKDMRTKKYENEREKRKKKL